MDYRAISSHFFFREMCFSGFIRCHASLKFIREALDNSTKRKKRKNRKKNEPGNVLFSAGRAARGILKR